MKLRMADGTIKVLEDVRYLPTMRRNLISLGTLVRKGFTIKMDASGMKVTKGSMVYMRAAMNGSQLYILEGKVICGEAEVSCEVKLTSPSDIWHLRLAHMSQKGLEVLSKANLLLGDKVDRSQ